MASAWHGLDLLLSSLPHRGAKELVEWRVMIKLFKVFTLISTSKVGSNDDADLTSLLLSIEDTVHKLLDQFHPLCIHHHSDDEAKNLFASLDEEFVKEIDTFVGANKRWYVTMLDSLLQESSSTSVFTLEGISLITSFNYEVVQSCDDNSEAEDLIEQMKTLQLLTGFVDENPAHNLLAPAEAFAINAHLFLLVPDEYMEHKLGVENLDGDCDFISYFEHLYYEACIQTLLSSTKLSRVDDAGEPEDALIDVKRLRSFKRNILKENNNIDADIVAALRDAGVIIFSLLLDHTNATEPDLGRVLQEDLTRRIEAILAQLGGKDPPQVPPALFAFSRTNQLGFADFVLEKLMDLSVKRIHEELVFLRSFRGDIVELRHQQEELQDLWNSVIEMASRVEILIDDLLLDGDTQDSSSASISSIMKDIKTLKPKIELKRSEIKANRLEIKVREEAISELPSQATTLATIPNEVIGFSDDARSIVDQLTRGSTHLKIVSIVGMPGLGKTSLATKVYNDNSVLHHFHVRAWCSISKALDKKNVLFSLLSQGLPLTIVIVAGIRATAKKPEVWKGIWDDLISRDASVRQNCTHALELSYDFLPDHLRPCFLYFGAFSEDEEVSADRLCYQWMAEGFVRKAEGKRTNDVAEGSLWELRKLKYLYLKGYCVNSGGILPLENLDGSPVLYELDKLSGALILESRFMERLMRKFPNICKLHCVVSVTQDDELRNLDTIVVPEFLRRLEWLHMSCRRTLDRTLKHWSLPPNLKKLVLSNFDLSSESMSTIGKLPNLEVLKLDRAHFEEETWEMGEGEFSKLRGLKFYEPGNPERKFLVQVENRLR
ncbi:OLC1v1025119C1 [Oldenlandia corymbosa var. corymbosa]|uniref:OLC1v1025119C1 n=1 Tax=Oldenlandia corymbosa var. corymbosa TaxID=529605 RepID=A0AAV1C3Z0_OLDCO|nr:OLC1v1025119C1 [Oldenlandia corymbosa var. corymbosa]